MPLSVRCLIVTLICMSVSCQSDQESQQADAPTLTPPPNFLFCIADDWSFPHAGVYGDNIVKTPNFDRVAKEGILFMNAFTASPSCAPSRAAILTGQEMWRLEEGSLLFGALSTEFPVYTGMLRENGYEVAYTGKAYGPADLERGGWTENPAGKAYQTIEKEVPKGIRSTDYAANFAQFMSERDASKPFCFWYGASEPHRRYGYGNGATNGYDLTQIQVPDFMPDVEETRNDVADYYFEVEWFDMHLGRMLDQLEEEGLLDNTVVVVTSDNGMPFPRAKSNLYTYGDQMPLAIRWGNGQAKVKIVHNPVSLTDIAPTFLELAGLSAAEAMTGQSLVPILLGQTEESARGFAVTALERHTICRPEMLGYPMRAIHTREMTYIHNFEPDRWPMGNPDFDAWPQGFYGDIDDGASKQVMMKRSTDFPKLFEMSFGFRPQEELFDHRTDPFQLNNLADDPTYAKQKDELKAQLFDYLRATADPRMNGESPWDAYPYAGGSNWEK
ncbi:MAG: sulfatase [Bacteroidota bacterium]